MYRCSHINVIYRAITHKRPFNRCGGKGSIGFYDIEFYYWCDCPAVKGEEEGARCTGYGGVVSYLVAGFGEEMVGLVGIR